MKVKIFLVLSIMFLLTGCNNQRQDSVTSSNFEELKSMYQAQGNYDTIMDFEDTQTIKTGVIFMNQFGKVTLNTDPLYTTHGAASAKLEIHGDIYNRIEYYPAMEFVLERQPIVKPDLTLYESVELDVYNASDRDIRIYASLGSFTKKLYNNATEFLLKKKQWTHMVIKLPQKLIGNQVPLEQLTSFYLWFDIPQKGESLPVLFMDYLCAKKITGNDIEMSRADNEIAFFENDWQIYAMHTKGAFDYKSNPLVSINENLNFVTEGKKSLKIKALIPFKGMSVYKGYPIMSFSKEYFPNIEKISSEGGFSVDIFNNTSERRFISIYVYDENENARPFFDIVLEPDRWTKISKDIEAIKEYQIDTDKISHIDFMWAESGDYKENLELYFDNFKLGGE